MATDAEPWRDLIRQWPANAESWRNLFRNWPDIERRGVIVTSFSEQIPFDGFATSDDLLLVERRSPDTMGARMVLVPYGNIAALKIVDVIKLKSFQSVGFATPPPRK